MHSNLFLKPPWLWGKDYRDSGGGTVAILTLRRTNLTIISLPLSSELLFDWRMPCRQTSWSLTDLAMIVRSRRNSHHIFSHREHEPWTSLYYSLTDLLCLLWWWQQLNLGFENQGILVDLGFGCWIQIF